VHGEFGFARQNRLIDFCGEKIGIGNGLQGRRQVAVTAGRDEFQGDFQAWITGHERSGNLTALGHSQNRASRRKAKMPCRLAHARARLAAE
jgi:hypothetical protein